jgi:hypothetical protein
MRVKLLGVQDFDRIEIRRNGELIDGVKIHYSFPDNSTYGEQSGSAFFKRTVYDQIGVRLDDLVDQIGKIIKIDYNRYGKVANFELLKSGEEIKVAV